MTVPTPEPATRRFEIASVDDRYWCAGEARRLSAEIGFDPKAQGEIAVSVAELVGNAAKHAGRGSLELSAIGDPRVGIRVVVEDHGPGLTDPEMALIDGYSEGRKLSPDSPRQRGQGLGVGLGAVVRLMSEVDIQNRPGQGLRIVAVRWLDDAKSPISGR
jgi:serine/threonine-protein kinase RsbT